MFTTPPRSQAHHRADWALVALATFLLAVTAYPAAASSVLYRSDAELVRMSDRVVHGRVVAVRAERVRGLIYTVARLAVIEDFTGGREVEIDVYELGGQIDRTRMVVTGSAEFRVGQEVIVCLERFGQGLLRSVAMSFSKFDVAPSLDGAAMAVRQPGAVVVGQIAAEPSARSVGNFREVVTAVKGTRPVAFAATQNQPFVVPDVSASTGDPEFGQFTLLGSGLRWNQAGTQAISWYRNPDAPAPVTSGNSEAEIATALSAWTAPTTSNLTLTYAGTRSLGGQSPYCTSVNAGVGLITYEDPTNEIGSGVLAIGGGCATSAGAQTINGQYFSSFSHAFVIFNTAAELGPAYQLSLNFARVLTHEIGHAIGLGHTQTGLAGATTNIMYPSCCYSNTPIPPALGADDLAGLEFIYPAGVGPTCTFSVTPTSTSVSPNHGQFVVAVTTDTGCTWQASSQSSWLTLSAASGVGSGTVTVTHTANAGGARLGALNIGGTAVSVMQSQYSTPTSCSYGVFPTNIPMGAGGGQTTLTLTVSSGCSWVAASSTPWIVVSGGQSGVGSGTVTLVVDVNAGPARSGGLLVAGHVVQVDQSAAATPCTYSVSPTTHATSVGGGTFTVAVSTGPTCSWSASAAVDWMAVSHGSQATGPATVTVVVNANQGATRTGSLAIAGETVTVTQTAATTSCSVTLVAGQSQFQSMGGATTVSVLTGSGCGWSAMPTAGWLSVTAGATGTANGVVSIAVAPNGGPARASSLMVGGEVIDVFQGANTVADADLDALPDSWEAQYGLSAASSANENGATGDPDGDGRSNLSEYQQDSHPMGAHTRYLAEGAVGNFFSTSIAVANPGLTPANVLLRFQTDAGTTVTSFLVVPSQSRRTFIGSSLSVLANRAFSSVIESDVPVVVDRRMEWDGTGYGGHSEASLESPATEWYLAEGATHSGFQLFYLLQNPGNTQAQVEVTYLLPSPSAPLVRHYTVGAGSRYNIWVNHEDAALAATDVSAVIRVTNAAAIIVERSMYLNTGGQLFGAGHNSAAVRAPAADWFLAEGATGAYFDTFVLIANPSLTAATVSARYLLPTGAVVERIYTVAPRSRRTVWVDYEASELADTAFSVDLHVVSGPGVIVERAMWWPGSASTWQDAHNTPGVTTAGTRWALADGEVGGSRSADTYILVANTGSAPATVRVTLLPEGQAPVERLFSVSARSRFNVDVRTYFPQMIGQRFGAIVTAETGGASIVVERALYWDAAGSHWAAGTVSAATLLP